MLVTFSCRAHGDVMMFGDVAKRLLKMMGHSGAIPSAIKAEDVPVVLERLQKAIDAERPKQEQGYDPNNSDNDKEPPVAIAIRAFPLIELLEAAVRDKCDVIWRS